MQEVQSPRRTPLSEQKHKNGNRERGRNLVCYACHLPQRTGCHASAQERKFGLFHSYAIQDMYKKREKVRALVPVVHNLLFVHARPSDVQRVKSQVTYLQYITDTRSGRRLLSQTVRCSVSLPYPALTMIIFFISTGWIELVQRHQSPDTGGEFEGQEGVFLKVKGARDRRVVIEIQGVIACCHGHYPSRSYRSNRSEL